MKLKKWISGVLCCSILFSTQLTVSPLRTRAASVSNKAATIGTVNLTGDSGFDSDSIMNDEDSQWRWLSYPESRMVMNYGKRNDAKYDGGMNLKTALVVNGFQTKNNLHKVQMGPKSGNVSDYKTLKTAWYPYKLTADATYEKGSLHMDEFFADKNTFVRFIDVKNAADAKMEMSARINGLSLQSDNTLLVDQKDYWLVYKFMSLDKDSNIKELLKPEVNGEDWKVKISFDSDTAKVAFSMTLMPKNVDTNSAATALKLAENTMKVGENISDKLQATKTFWDGKLAKVPAPTEWGVEGNQNNAPVSPEDHKRAFYAAWTFQYQNIVEPTPEKEYPYYQVTLGKASTWASGAPDAPNSCAWESFFNIQQLSLVEPVIAWDAVKGFIHSIDENGILKGECLPSQKAHTVWVCYSNLLRNGINKRDELEEMYPAIRNYLLWRSENPRWIYNTYDFSDEKDISFVTQWFSDVNYAIKICEELGKYDDIAMYENLKTQMSDNAREWFFKEYDYATGNGRIMAFRFLNKSEGEARYNQGGHNSYHPDALNYVYSALFADFPRDLTDKLVKSYLDFKDHDAPLLGFDFYKYGDGIHTAIGLMEKELQYPELAGEWKKYVSAVLCNVVKNVDFAECLRVTGNTTKLEGVEPSSFNATAMIDYTYMLNGLRIDMGNPVAIQDATIEKTSKTDAVVYTIKGTKPELPKTVPVVNGNGEELEALAIWPEILEEDYNGAKTEFEIEGDIYGTDLKVTATVKVHHGDVTIDPVKRSVLVGNIPILPQTVPATYELDGNIHNCVVNLKWNEMKAEDFASVGVQTVGGKIEFNQQEIEAEINVLKGLVIEADNIGSEGTLEQYQTARLKLVNQNDEGQEYTDVSWSIRDAGNDAIAGISENGILLPVKPGEVIVQATVKDTDGNQLTASKVFTIEEKNVVSFAYGASASASNSSGEAANPAKAVDENEMTWWRADNNNANQWFQIDMEKTIPVEGVKIRWYEGNQPKSIELKVSEDGTNWNSAYTRITGINSGRENYSEIIVLKEAIDAKYIRIESSQAGDNSAGIVELQVFGNPKITSATENITITSQTGEFAITEKGAPLQLKAEVTPSNVTDSRVEWFLTDSNGNPTDIGEITSYGLVNPKKNGTVIAKAAAVDGSGKVAEEYITITNQELENVVLNKSAGATTNSGEAYKAIDGDRSTRWGSERSAPQNSHFTVDLQGEYSISSIAVYFETALPIDFILQYSEDGTTWEEIKSVTGNTEQNLRYSFEPVKAKYLRIQALKTTNKEWGFSIWEFEAYGNSAKVSKDALLSLYNSVKDLKEEDYTVDSFATFRLALEAAQNILALEEAAQEEVDKALEDLSLAQDGLVLVAPNNSAVIDPTNLYFDKNPDYQEDVNATVTWNDATGITDISHEGNIISLENYEVNGDKLTFKKEYLTGLAVGEHDLVVGFNIGNPFILNLNIIDTTENTHENPSLNPARLTFYKNKESQEDIKTNIIWNDAAVLTDIKQDGDSIGSENYVVSGSSLTIKKEYLDDLPEGDHILKVEFDKGDAADLYVSILDDTSVPEVSAVIHPTSARFDKKPGNQADIHFTITWNDALAVTDVMMDGQPVELGDYEVNSSKLIIKKEYLRGLAVGKHIFTIEFDKGSAAYLNVTIVKSKSSSSNDDNDNDYIPTPVKTEPEMIGSNGAAGWEAIIKNMPVPAEEEMEPNQVTIHMNQSRILPKEFLTFLKGKNTIVKLQLGDYHWLIHGMDITGEELKDIDLSVTRKENLIPGDIVKDIAKGNKSVEIHLAYNGELGFEGTLNFNLDKNNAGLYGNLFYYDPATKTLLLQDVNKIDPQGNTELTFNRGSDYAIVISNEPLLENEIDKITISPKAKTLYFGGTTSKSALINVNLPEVITRALENGVIDEKITYQSSNNKIAAVSKTGKITGHKNGTVTIKTKVTIGDFAKTFTSKIKVQKARIKVDKKTNHMKVGEKVTFTVKCYGYKKTDVKYTTTKRSIVVIGKNSGKASAKSKGKDCVVIKAGNNVKKIGVMVK